MKKLLAISLALLCAVSMPAHAVRRSKLTHITVTAAPGLVEPAVNNIATNWANAGDLSVGGIPTRSTICATPAMSGLIPPQTNDDSDKWNAAITACPAGQTVQGVARTATTAVVTITGNALVLVSGALAVGNGLSGTNLQSGETVTAQTDSTHFTVNMPPAPGTTVSSETVSAFTQYNFASSKPILLNKAVTLQGADNCTTITVPPYCSTVFHQWDGALADWSISSATAGAKCGVTTAGSFNCSISAGLVLMSPSGVFNWGWSGCAEGTNPTTGNCGALLTADAAQGDTVLHVASTTGFTVGGWLLIDENPAVVSTTNPTGGAAIEASSDFLSASASPATMRLAGGDEPTSYSFSPNRVNEELHKITAIGSGTITIDDPLTLAFRQSGGHDARVYYPTIQGATTANPFLVRAGLKNVSIVNPGAGGVEITFCEGCFVRNVEVGGWIAGAINAIYAARPDIQTTYLHDCFDCENNGAEYPVGFSEATTEALLADSIVVRGGKGMVGRASGSNVIAYNYVDMTFYMQSGGIGDYWVDMGCNGSHYAGAHHWLFEGNWCDNLGGDETHGNAIYDTFFRNQGSGLRTTFADPSNPSLTVNDTAGTGFTTGATPNGTGFRRAAGPMAFDYWFAYIGNVLGTSGQTTSANGWVYRCAPPNVIQSNKCIWGSGWTGAEWPAADTNLSGSTGAYIFKNANYDYFNNAIIDNASGFSQSLPSSMYLTGAPSFFTGTTCTYTWPWVTPQSSPQVQTNSCGGSGLPAKARYENGSPFKTP